MLVYLHNFYIFHEVYGFIVFNATFINISVISWRSVLMMEETGSTLNHIPSGCMFLDPIRHKHHFFVRTA
jgi:hypothetical protein